MTQKQHIIIGISGGVDSAVAAYLLKKAGHDVEGIFMKNWEAEDNDNNCPAAKDLLDAQMVCDHLKIPFHVVNFASEYWQYVFSNFLTEYQKGRTPNPDILCNKEIKFKAFLNYAKQLGADKIATGHYVRAQANQLLKAIDINKDQSYFLYALTKEQINASVFPLGTYNKPSIRKLAEQIGLNNFNKKDSTGICFIGERKFKPFLENYLPAQPGSIESIDGDILGQHEGLIFYTIGQRQGLNIGGKKGKAQLPWYVVKKDLQRNVLIIAQGEHPALYQNQLYVKDLHWNQDNKKFPIYLHAKTRYRQPDQACILMQIDTENYQVTFEKPQRAITPGQSIVFYQHDICLGGGIIDH